MVAGGKGRAGKAPAVAVRRRSGAGQAQNDAEEAMQDAAAELNDTTAVLDGDCESAGPTVPSAVLQRRLDKARQEKEAEKADKEKSIKEKELLQKQMDEMAAQLQLAKANVGDVVSVTPPARKVCWKAYLSHRLML
jgi:hypothetical protein